MSQAQEAPMDRFCDLVMKGGITSGIVYPPVVQKLAQHYRFKNIGGTSAGAIAAVATAAAEYSRRKGGGEAAFERLGKLPEKLGEKVNGRNTKLFSLFQPAPGCQRLFGVLMSSLNAKGTWHRVRSVLWGLLKCYWPATILAVAASSLAFVLFGALAAAFSLVGLLLVLIGYGMYFDITRNLPSNNYGMCTGMSKAGAEQEAITPWLHGLIQNLAGRAVDDPPLTFGDLWKAPGFPPAWIEPPTGTIIRSIDLRIFTTSLSHGRPFVLPLTNETCRLFFLPHEIEPLLPKTVFTWMLEHSKEYDSNLDRIGSDPERKDAPIGFRELPCGEDFPVLLAARMSLSFPILFSAIPLWAIDYDSKKGERGFERCMFSDGGISSNFPIHLFDSFLPMWPTFGVQLEPKLPARPNMTFLPLRYLEGYGERWNRFANLASVPATRMGGFLSAVVSTMQNWNDNTVSRMPGVRDRVVRVRLNDDEGGMNLNMDPEIITRVAERGALAADDLLARFGLPSSGKPNADGWTDQRWIRLGVTLSMLHKRFVGVGLALRGSGPHAMSFEDIIDRGKGEVLPGAKNMLTDEQATALRISLKAMESFDGALRACEEQFSFDPVPEPDLRVRPSL
jgi:predicted acylesterase/phospholipase RssA